MDLGFLNLSNVVELVEIGIVTAIILLQMAFFIKTKKSIKVYRSMLPVLENLHVAKVQAPNDLINATQPHEVQKILFSEDPAYQQHRQLVEMAVKDPNVPKIELSLIQSHAKQSSQVFDKILTTINSYIIRSRNKALDFNMIQDIVERQVNTQEEQIRLTVGVPLYLGLMTTMIGIIVGLFSMPDLANTMTSNFANNDNLLNQGITNLIGGVKIAMVASLVGLAMTTYLSSITLRKTKQKVEQIKDDFYAFTQLELLPVINQSLPSTISSLQENLVKFNEGFRGNLDQLSEVFGKNTEAIQAQKELFEALDREKIISVSEHNVKVMQELQQSTTKIEQLNLYLDSLGKVLHNSQAIVNTTDAVLKRTQNIESIAEGMNTSINDNKEIMQFIRSDIDHIRALRVDSRTNLNDYNQQISDMFAALLQHMRDTTFEIKRFTAEEYNAIETALSADRDIFRQLDELHDIKKAMTELLALQKTLPEDKSDLIVQQLQQLNAHQSNLSENLNQLTKLINTLPDSIASIHIPSSQVPPSSYILPDEPIEKVKVESQDLFAKLQDHLNQKADQQRLATEKTNVQLNEIISLLQALKVNSSDKATENLDDTPSLTGEPLPFIAVTNINDKPKSSSWFSRWFKRS